MQRTSLPEAVVAAEPYGGAWPRREVLKVLAALGGASPVFLRALVALAAEKPQVTAEMIRQAEWVSGLTFTDDDRKLMLKGVGETLENYAKLRAVPLDNSVAPALWFEPAPLEKPPARRPARSLPASGTAAFRRPTSDDDVAFASVKELAALLRSRQISSTELTKIYLARLRRFDPLLRCVITYTEELADRKSVV